MAPFWCRRRRYVTLAKGARVLAEPRSYPQTGTDAPHVLLNR